MAALQYFDDILASLRERDQRADTLFVILIAGTPEVADPQIRARAEYGVTGYNL